MGRSGSVIVAVGALLAMLAAVLAVGLRGPGFRSIVSAIGRFIRSDDDHPQWELLMQ